MALSCVLAIHRRPRFASSTLQADPDNTTKVLPDGSISVGKTAHDENPIEIPIRDEIHTGLRRRFPTISWTSSSTSTWIPSFPRGRRYHRTQDRRRHLIQVRGRDRTQSSSTRSQFPHYPQTSPISTRLRSKPRASRTLILSENVKEWVFATYFGCAV